MTQRSQNAHKHFFSVLLIHAAVPQCKAKGEKEALLADAE